MAGRSRRDKLAGNEWKWANIYTAPAVGTGVQAARGGQVFRDWWEECVDCMAGGGSGRI